MPDAATAVVAAAIEDAARDGCNDPAATARRAVSALEAAGWTLTPSRTPHAPQRAA